MYNFFYTIIPCRAFGFTFSREGTNKKAELTKRDNTHCNHTYFIIDPSIHHFLGSHATESVDGPFWPLWQISSPPTQPNIINYDISAGIANSLWWRGKRKRSQNNATNGSVFLHLSRSANIDRTVSFRGRNDSPINPTRGGIRSNKDLPSFRRCCHRRSGIYHREKKFSHSFSLCACIYTVR